MQTDFSQNAGNRALFDSRVIVNYAIGLERAGVAELVDAPDSKSGFFGSASSILALGTILNLTILPSKR